MHGLAYRGRAVEERRNGSGVMFDFLRRLGVGGYIAHFHLQEWWFSVLTEEDRRQITASRPYMSTTANINPSRTPSDVLRMLRWSELADNYGLMVRVFDKAIDLAEKGRDPVDMTLTLGEAADYFRSHEGEEGAHERTVTHFEAIRALARVFVEKAHRLSEDEKEQPPWQSWLSRHEVMSAVVFAYDYLAKSLARGGEFDRAIMLCREARDLRIGRDDIWDWNEAAYIKDLAQRKADQGQFQEAVLLCRQAKDRGLPTDWDKNIAHHITRAIKCYEEKAQLDKAITLGMVARKQRLPGHWDNSIARCARKLADKLQRERRFDDAVRVCEEMKREMIEGAWDRRIRKYEEQGQGARKKEEGVTSQENSDDYFDFKCPHCGKVLRIRRDLLGATGKCNHCGNRIVLPRVIP